MSLDLVSFASLAAPQRCSWGSTLCEERRHPDRRRPPSCPEPSTALQAELLATAAPYPASQIPLGFQPFSLPLLPARPGAGSSYAEGQKGSRESQRAAEPSAALPPAAGYLGSGGRVPQTRHSSLHSSCPLTLSQQLFPRTQQHFQLGREHFIQLRLAGSLNEEM